MKPETTERAETDTNPTASNQATSKQTDSQATPLEPRVIAELLEESLEERGRPDRRQGILPDRKPAIERRSPVPRRSSDKT